MPKSEPLIELYMLRHAQTEMNTNRHLVGGRSNKTPLTQHGIWQSKRLGNLLLAKNITPHRVFVSPADRTLETARISLDAMQLDIEPIVQDEIQELSQGFAEGRLSAEIYTDEIRADIERLGKDFKLEGGESMNEVGQRMYQWVMKTFNREQVHGPQRHFIYTHGGAIKYLASHILGWDHERTYATEIDNTSVNLFTFQDNELSVAYLNREAEDI